MAEPNSVIVETSNPGVKEVARQFGVYEDGALAYKLQEEENVTHYSGNISRRRTVRDDREVAKGVAKDVALEAFREEHEMAERNMRIEEEDEEKARQMQIQMIKEEQEKALKEQEEDRERARLLQIQIIKEEQENAMQAKETDEMLARRLQMEEKKRLEAERRKKLEARQMKQDEHLARRLSQQEGHRQHPHHDDQHQHHAGHHHEQQHRHEPQHDHQLHQRHSGKRREKTNHIEESFEGLKLDDAGDKHSQVPMGAQLGAAGAMAHQPLVVSLDTKDSDEESDALAKVRHDEILAKKIHREEKQRSRPRTLSEIEQKQLEHDEKIARKMQHEEVMLAKKKTYNRYRQRISDEVADPAPMVHVSKEKKVPVLAEAKESNGITLTDVSRPMSAECEPAPEPGTTGGNILASIDPTYNAKSSSNVILTKRTPIGDAAPPQEPSPPPSKGAPDNFMAVQGTRRSSGKEKEKDKKRGSIFSKLKKK